MVAPAISSIYLQHKADTARIANWLGNAANNLGYDGTGIFTPTDVHYSDEYEETAEGISKAEGSSKLSQGARKKANVRARARASKERQSILRTRFYDRVPYYHRDYGGEGRR